MLSLPDRAAVEHALIGALPPRLRELLTERLAITVANGVADLTHYVVVQPGDTEADIVGAIGLTPLVNPLNDARYATADFHAWWDWLADRNGWFEMVISVGNSGFGYVLLVQADESTLPALLHLCRRYAQ